MIMLGAMLFKGLWYICMQDISRICIIFIIVINFVSIPQFMHKMQHKVPYIKANNADIYNKAGNYNRFRVL